MTDLHDRIREFWDRDAATYDDSPSHAVSDPLEAAAWKAALASALPPAPARVMDVGAGTGSLSLLAAELGHRVTALDLSPAMLERARAKASERGLEIDLVVGSAMEPPAGPFDAVMERHVLWTTLDPAGALKAWREAAPGGRLALFEGVWGSSKTVRRARDLAARGVRKLVRSPPDHHAPYPPEVVDALPFRQLTSPIPLIEAVQEAGWRSVRIRRLRDVEWALRLHQLPPLGWLEHLPRYVLIADA